MSLLELGSPAAQRLALVGEVGVPAVERLVLPLGARVGDRRLETGRRERAVVPTLDQREGRDPVREARCKPAPHPRAPGEAQERGLLDAELREQRGGRRCEPSRAQPVRRRRRRAAVARRVGSDHAQPMLLRQQRPELVRVQTGAAKPVPIEERRGVVLAPLVDEERADPGGPHSWFRCQTSRMPSRVRNGSIVSSVFACGTIRSARPPVATVCASLPSSSRMRSTIPSTWPAKP
jgi:hypothetical protein